MRINPIHPGDEYRTPEGEIRMHEGRAGHAVVDGAGIVRAIRNTEWEASIVARGIKQYERDCALRGTA